MEQEPRQRVSPSWLFSFVQRAGVCPLLLGLDAETYGLDHVLRSEDGVKIFLREDAVLDDEVVDTTARFEGFLSDLRGVLIADDGVEGGDDADAVADVVAALVFVGGDTVNAEGAEGVEAVDQQVNGFEAALSHYGLHSIEFHLRSIASHRDAEVITHDLVADLAHHFGDNGVDLTWHDGGAWLHSWEVDFSEAAARTTGEEAQVVTDLVDLDGDATEGGAISDHLAGVAGSADEVVCTSDVPARDLRHCFGAVVSVFGFGGNPRTDRCSPHVDREELLRSVVEVSDFVTQDGGKATEGLSERHRYSVLELSASHLDHVSELLSLLLQSFDELEEVGAELEVGGIEPEVDGRGIGIVRRLRAVDVVVGGEVLELALLVTHDLEGTVADDLVGIHVRRRPCAALDHIHGEVLVVLAFEELVAGLDDRVLLLVGEQAKAVVSDGCSFLGPRKAVDEEGIVAEMEGADAEVFFSAQGLHPVEVLVADLAFADQVAFKAKVLA